MTDDADLRARIEARVAARQAAAASGPAADPSGDEPSADGTAGDTDPLAAIADPTNLVPTRPWERDARAAPATGDAGVPLAPTRPWNDPAPPGRLSPARPWQQDGSSAGGSDAPEPSEPDVVLRPLVGVVDAEPGPAVSEAERERLRSFARRHAAADALLAGASSVDAARPPEDDESTGDEVDGGPRRRRFARRAAEPDASPDAASPRHAADGDASPAPSPVASAAAVPVAPAGAPEPDGTAEGESEDLYPWLRTEDVDLDLKGAPTWDPSQYADEPDAGQGRKGRRAAKWLFARRPDGEDDDAAHSRPRPGPATYRPEPPEHGDDGLPGSSPEPVAAAAAPEALAHEPAADEHTADEPAAEPDQPEVLAPIVLEPPEFTIDPEPDDPPTMPVAPEPIVLEPPTIDLPQAAATSPGAGVPAAPGVATEASPVDPGDDQALAIELDDDLGHRYAEPPPARAAATEVPAAEPTPPVTPAEPTPPARGRWFRRRSGIVADDLPAGDLPDDETSTDEPTPVAAPTAAPTPERTASPVSERPRPRPRPTTPGSNGTAPPTPAAPAPPTAVSDGAESGSSSGTSTSGSSASGPAPTPGRRPRPAPTGAAAPTAPDVAEPAPAPPQPEPSVAPEPPAEPEPEPQAEPEAQAEPEPQAEPDPAAATEPETTASPRVATVSGAPVGGTSFVKAGEPDLSRFLEASEPQPGDDERDEKPPRGPSRFRRFVTSHRRGAIGTGIVVLVAVVAAFLLRAYVVAPYYIPSASMEPTLHGCPTCTDDHILVDKFSYRLHDPKRSDIVVFDRPKNVTVPDKVLIKRIVGLPGDRIQLRSGVVFVNGARLDEPYINPKCGARPSVPTAGRSSWTVPDNGYFVMGDNRCDSTDSRSFGSIPKSSIVGRAWLIIWPFHRIGSI